MLKKGEKIKMEIAFGNRLKHAFNVFMNRDPTYYRNTGVSYSYRPDRVRLTGGNERSIITSIYNRIAVDVASVEFVHAKLDKEGRYSETMESGLQNCLSLEANLDQTGRAFILDAVLSMLDEGVVALIPVETSFDPEITSSYSIDKMRVGKILEWYPAHIRVKVYNEKTGRQEEIIQPKSSVAIIENPFYSIMNERNSTMQRLIRKLNILDVIDEQSGSGKLDLIIQLPYVVKSTRRQQQAEERRSDIEKQLSGSKYGIAYTDGTERITQLNRPVDNNLMNQIEYLTKMLFSQLGFTQGILDGTADEETMLNYNNRIIEPIVSAFVDEMKRKFLTKTARTQRQSILFFRDPFKLIPISKMPDIADKFSRNEIVSSNEVRQKIGMKPSNDPKADKLENKNIKKSNEDGTREEKIEDNKEENQNGKEI